MDHQSITGHEFDLNRRGYDPDEVDAHLREIAADVAAKEDEINELRRAMAELQAKVRDADESEEALRLTLKAAAHAKEELLASAREKAETLEREATERAHGMVREAELNAATITDEAEAKVAAMTEGATARAREVARAALSETELLVVRIEQLRTQVQGAEDALRALSSEGGSQLEQARQVLDSALDAARASAENPELLAAAATPPPPPPPPPAQTPAPSPPMPAAPRDAGMPYDAAGQGEQAVMQNRLEPRTPSQGSEPEAPRVAEGADTAGDVQDTAGEEGTVAESSADISDKVDRLLEELREVT